MRQITSLKRHFGRMKGSIILTIAVFCGAVRTSMAFLSHSLMTTPSASGTCKDKLATCTLLDKSVYCSGEYIDYAFQNCRKTCNLCNYEKWMLFLKGVAGAPGPDLYQLWYSSQTINHNVLQAQNLTSEFNGHYKPGYSNEWNDFCIDKVKVAIYRNGVEKANITFNAVGADKNNWFTSDRIISSTWSDIKTAQKEIFSLAGDADTGREFYVSGQSSKIDSCDSFGWIMVSTKSSCFFEAGDKKPAFYYAPGTSQAHWGFTNPGIGDVFAILAHSKCPHYVDHTSQAAGPKNESHTTQAARNVCEYKGKHYSQDQHWTDGCQYNCSCEDASIGYYRCRNLCPMYSVLPPGCKLQTKIGECCAKPICPGNYPTIKPHVPVYLPLCSYKGQYYRQDETWNDGCTASCTCVDAYSGRYACRAVNPLTS